MTTQIITVPYALSRRDFGTGLGPQAILDAGLVDALPPGETHLQTIELPADLDTDVEAIFGANRLISEAVHAATAKGEFPLVLAGNCNSAVGAVSGLDKANLGLIWFDAHGDFNTPDTTTTGFLDGMGLATLVGLCWKGMTATIPGFVSHPRTRILHIGGRSFDPVEESALRHSRILVETASTLHLNASQVLEPSLTMLRENGAQYIHLHLDLDVLDPAEARANRYADPGGLSSDSISAIINLLQVNFVIASATIASYDPAVDPERKTARLAVRFAEQIVQR